LSLALSDRANNANVVVLENLGVENAPSTKKAAQALTRNRIAANTKILVISAEDDHNTYLSVRNLPNTAVVFPRNVNVYDVLRTQKVIFDVKSLIELTKNPKTVTINAPSEETTPKKRSTAPKSASSAKTPTKASAKKSTKASAQTKAAAPAASTKTAARASAKTKTAAGVKPTKTSVSTKSTDGK
jgi:hypothetical protein